MELGKEIKSRIYRNILDKNLSEGEARSELRKESDEVLCTISHLEPTEKYAEEWGIIKAFSQVELERRSKQAIEQLARKTTLWSVAGGAFAAVVGAIIGAGLTAFFGS